MSIIPLLREVRRTFLLFQVFDAFLTAMAVFLGVAVIALPFDFSVWYAVALGGVYFIGRSFLVFLKRGYGAVEKQIPELEWQLRTSADTLNTQNVLVDTLRKEVFQSVKKIKPNYFLNGKSVALRLVVISCLSFLVVGSAFFNLDLALFGHLFKDNMNKGARVVGAAVGLPNDGIFEKESGRDPYGKEGAVADLGTEELNLEITPEQTSVDLGNIGSPDSKSFSQTGKLGTIGAVAEGTSVEKISKKDEELSKNYLLKISQLNSS